MIEQIRFFGTNMLYLEWRQTISDEIIDEISHYVRVLQTKELNGILDIVPAYASITIYYDPSQINFQAIAEVVKEIKYNRSEKIVRSLRSIPVLYDQEESKDMSAIMQYTGLTRFEIINLHCQATYKVCFIGFLPGFLYLSGLHPLLCMPRKQVPALVVPKGSVAIGGCQTGIYPQSSPGGWHVIGHSDLNLFNFDLSPFSVVHPGDLVRFEPVG